jgi:phosphatidylglycerophosphate synthase
MLDRPLRMVIDPALAPAAGMLARAGVSANVVTAAAFLAGLGALGAIATHNYLLGLGLIVANRLLDGLDGLAARLAKVTDLGAFAAASLQFVFYAGVPFAFALADPDRALAAAFLIFAFAASGSIFLAYAVFAAKRGFAERGDAPASFHTLGGLIEGSETFVAFAIVCIVPAWFGIVAYVLGALCFVTAGMRLATGVARFRES